MFKPYHRAYLKVKIKSLAAESKIIRHEEKKYWEIVQRNGLYRHRVYNVRNEARAALLAYAFLRGKSWHKTETPKKNGGFTLHLDIIGRAFRMVKKYGTPKALEGWYHWIHHGEHQLVAESVEQ